MNSCLVCDSIFTTSTKTYCGRCLPVVRQIQSTAQAKTRAGNPPDVTGLICLDCGKPAQAYDHRHYSRPLEIDPVCVNCNRKRGPSLDIRELARSALGLDGTEPTYVAPQPRRPAPLPYQIDLQAMMDFIERREIMVALNRSRGNMTAAAKLLGISYRSMRYRMERLNID